VAHAGKSGVAPTTPIVASTISIVPPTLRPIDFRSLPADLLRAAVMGFSGCIFETV
jgi:hypothetical protein